MKTFTCIIHGSFSKHFSLIKQAKTSFEAAGIAVLAPKTGEPISNNNGFALFEDERQQDPRLVELLYLHNLKKLGADSFSYFVVPDGYIGKSTSYELGIAQLTNTRCFFSHKLVDHPAYQHRGSIVSSTTLADYIRQHETLPPPAIKRSEARIHQLWQDLLVPGSVVSVGAIIEHQAVKGRDKEVLLVKTHKWSNQFSIVGDKVRRGERLHDALVRKVTQQTKLRSEVGKHICTFDEIKDSGYYRPGVQRIFVDNIVKVKHKKVTLNHEAQDYVWALPSEALHQLDIEPNARITLELYANAIK